jgi:hypothetical protein
MGEGQLSQINFLSFLDCSDYENAGEIVCGGTAASPTSTMVTDGDEEAKESPVHYYFLPSHRSSVAPGARVVQRFACLEDGYNVGYTKVRRELAPQQN